NKGHSELRPQPAVPETLSHPAPFTLHAEPCEVAADVLQVACEQPLGTVIEARINHLGEVDHGEAALPEEDVVLGEVTVDQVLPQKELDLADQDIQKSGRIVV